jgi:hypothetical protein
MTDPNSPSIGPVFSAELYFNWSIPKFEFGFGQLSARIDDHGIAVCDAEGLDREKVRAIMHAFADHFTDTCILE